MKWHDVIPILLVGAGFATSAQAVGLVGNYHESNGTLLNIPLNPPVVPCDGSADNARCHFKQQGFFGQGIGASDAPGDRRARGDVDRGRPKGRRSALHAPPRFHAAGPDPGPTASGRRRRDLLRHFVRCERAGRPSAIGISV